MRIRTGILVVAFLLSIANTAWATLIDPATLHIGPGAGTFCAITQPSCTTDPNNVGSGHVVSIYQNSGGAKDTVQNPLLLILGIPNDTTNLFPTNPILSDVSYNPYPDGFPGSGVSGSSSFATAGTFGLKASVSNGFFGDMTAGQEVYGFLELDQPADNSNSFTNWAGTDFSRSHITATNFGIYVFALTFPSSSGLLGPNGLVNVTFNGTLPTGTYAVAYGQNSTHIFDTPFTEAGYVNERPPLPPAQVAEPATLVLLGSALVVLAGLAYRRRA